jgi:hypothetical protein
VVATIELFLLVFAVNVAHIIDRAELRAAKPVPEGFADQHFNQRRDVDTETKNHCSSECEDLSPFGLPQEAQRPRRMKSK